MIDVARVGYGLREELPTFRYAESRQQLLKGQAGLPGYVDVNNGAAIDGPGLTPFSKSLSGELLRRHAHEGKML